MKIHRSVVPAVLFPFLWGLECHVDIAHGRRKDVVDAKPPARGNLFIFITIFLPALLPLGRQPKYPFQSIRYSICYTSFLIDRLWSGSERHWRGTFNGLAKPITRSVKELIDFFREVLQ
jgi:hypothetical protein